MDRIAERLGIDERKLVKSMDVIGDIAIIKVPEELIDLKFEIGKAIIDELKYIKVVFRQASEVSGIYRLRRLEWLAGERRSTTIYVEHGCRFMVDVEKVYFSPRLSNERIRIANLVEDGETVINMFAGVGPYSIIIAKKKPKTIVYSIDINPEAVRLHIENCRLNKVQDRVKVIQGDSFKILKEELIGVADRVLMPLPERALEGVDAALSGLKDRGFIHVYLHVPYRLGEKEALSEAIELVRSKILKLGVKKAEFKANRVREVKTRVLQVCVDAFVEKS
ncbi:class I SAM-dependent methyltransferase family protein [Candidatus Geothermarchaeota archaeon]|nr:MAG: class I SAM-dependent methyltransferase family protein [Candidatus Geothermarchaeota archaeon]